MSNDSQTNELTAEGEAPPERIWTAGGQGQIGRYYLDKTESATVEYIEKSALDRELPQLSEDNLSQVDSRLLDLVRHSRDLLHEANLITDEEYAVLTMMGVDSVQRLVSDAVDAMSAEGKEIDG